jgi:hypothetical protein
MPTVALSGTDTVSINNRVLNDLADGNCVELSFPNEIANVKTGKNGNSIYGFNATGKQCEVKLRVVRGSSDDKFLLGLISEQQSSAGNGFADFILMIGQFIKKLGDGKGNVANDTYNLSGGIFSKQVEGKMNVEGDIEQSISMYSLKFSNAPRAIA